MKIFILIIISVSISYGMINVTTPSVRPSVKPSSKPSVRPNIKDNTMLLGICTMEYSPVCGEFNHQEKTFSNRCLLDRENAYEYKHNGKCEEKIKF